MDGQGVMRPHYSIVDGHSYTAGSHMLVNLAAVHFGMGLALCGSCLASSLYKAFRWCLGYHAQLCSLSWIYNEMLSDLLIQFYETMEAKNNCNASTKGLQNMLDLLEKTHSDQCDHLSFMAVNVWPVQHKKSRVLFQIQLSLLQSLRLNPIANFYLYCLFLKCPFAPHNREKIAVGEICLWR